MHPGTPWCPCQHPWRQKQKWGKYIAQFTLCIRNINASKHAALAIENKEETIFLKYILGHSFASSFTCRTAQSGRSSALAWRQNQFEYRRQKFHGYCDREPQGRCSTDVCQTWEVRKSCTLPYLQGDNQARDFSNVTINSRIRSAFYKINYNQVVNLFSIVKLSFKCKIYTNSFQ